jgi:hypothetical protein
MFGLGQDRATLFGIQPSVAAAPPPTQNVNFATCGPELWRSAAVRDSLYGGMIP